VFGVEAREGSGVAGGGAPEQREFVFIGGQRGGPSPGIVGEGGRQVSRGREIYFAGPGGALPRGATGRAAQLCTRMLSARKHWWGAASTKVVDGEHADEVLAAGDDGDARLVADVAGEQLEVAGDPASGGLEAAGLGRPDPGGRW
jgi:hypothetical protein